MMGLWAGSVSTAAGGPEPISAMKPSSMRRTVLLALGVVLSGCTDTNGSASPTTTTTSAAELPVDRPFPPTCPSEPDPKSPPPCGNGLVTGQRYPYRLLLRCGIDESVVLGGAYWDANPPPPQGGEALVLAATDHEPSPDFAVGEMTLTSPVDAEFHTSWGLAVHFKPATSRRDPPC